MLILPNLRSNADEPNTFISLELDTVSDADKATNATLLDKTREVIKGTFHGEIGAKFATDIANGIQLQRIKQYEGNASSASSSSTEARATRTLTKQAAMDAALAAEKWR